MIKPEQISAIGKIARKYGVEDLHLTTRQTIELPHVDPSRLDSLLADLRKNGTPLGAEREEVVNVTACLGTRHCKFGNIDSIGLARELDKRFLGRELPVKVRIAISACPNGCTSERLNEIGITGTRKPIRDPGLCTGCGTCTFYCKEKAIEVVDGIIVLHKDRCMECGFCIMPCPFHIIQGEDPTYKITLGGTAAATPGSAATSSRSTRRKTSSGSSNASSPGSTGRHRAGASFPSSWTSSNSTRSGRTCMP